MKRILLTGASGRIGSVFYKTWQGHYRITLCDRTAPRFDLAQGDRFIQADLSNSDTAKSLAAGQEAIVHLAGIPDPDAKFDDLLPANMLATTYLLEAASKGGCSRFVFASSAQTIEGYPVDIQIPSTAYPRPANIYGVTKCYGEALCAYHAQTSRMSCVSLRIGAFEPKGSDGVANARDLSAWLSHRDAASLIERALEAEIEGHFIGYGISDNRFRRMDLTETKRRLGYEPKDDAFAVFDVPNLIGR